MKRFWQRGDDDRGKDELALPPGDVFRAGALTYSQVRTLAEQRAVLESWDLDPGHRDSRPAILWHALDWFVVCIVFPLILAGWWAFGVVEVSGSPTLETTGFVWDSFPGSWSPLALVDIDYIPEGGSEVVTVSILGPGLPLESEVPIRYLADHPERALLLGQNDYSTIFLWIYTIVVLVVVLLFCMWVHRRFWRPAHGEIDLHMRYVRFRDVPGGDWLVLFDEGADTTPSWYLRLAGRVGPEVPLAGSVRLRCSKSGLTGRSWARPTIDGVVWRPDTPVRRLLVDGGVLVALELFGGADPPETTREQRPASPASPASTSFVSESEAPPGQPEPSLHSTPGPSEAAEVVGPLWSQERTFVRMSGLAERRAAAEGWHQDPERRPSASGVAVRAVGPPLSVLMFILVGMAFLGVTDGEPLGETMAFTALLGVPGAVIVAAVAIGLRASGLREASSGDHIVRMRYVRLRDRHRGDTLVLFDAHSDTLPDWVLPLAGRCGPDVPLAGIVEFRCDGTTLAKPQWVRPVIDDVVWLSKGRVAAARSRERVGPFSRLMSGEPEPSEGGGGGG